VNADSAVLDLASIAVVLTGYASGTLAALGSAGFVDQPDRLGMGMMLDNQLDASIANLFLIPLD